MAATVTLSEFGWSTVLTSLSLDMSHNVNAGRWRTAIGIAEQAAKIAAQLGMTEEVKEYERCITSFRYCIDCEQGIHTTPKGK